MGLKENNGRGARRKMMRRVGVASVASLVFVMVLVKLMPPSQSQRRQQLAQRLRQFADRAAEASPMKGLHKKKAKKGDTWKSDTDNVLEEIVQGKLHLVDIRTDISELATAHKGDYAGVYGSFCRLNWAIHKQDPSSVPMFRDLVQKSPDCQQPRIVPLKKAATAVREFDTQHQYAFDSNNTPKLLNMTAVVFHESRCGSTLVANLCVAANPTGHRVYSESSPPIAALTNVCGSRYQHCSQDTAASILQDTLYLMSRTDDAQEERVFFKIQSIGTHSLPLFQYAFPDTPWLFVFREPVQVMMSHLANGVRYANCVRNQRSPPTAVLEVTRHHGVVASSLGPEDYCAAHLASITETAVEALEEAGSKGMAVNYKDLPDAFYQEILPSVLGVELGPAEIHQMEQVAHVYSKGRGDKAGEFKGDSEKKEEKATDAIRSAAETFLMSSYEALEKSAENRKRRMKQALE